MVSNRIISNAIDWFDKSGIVPTSSTPEWRKARNSWLEAQGVCGVIKKGKKSRSFPKWWEDGTEFWFDKEELEQSFINRWAKEKSE